MSGIQFDTPLDGLDGVGSRAVAITRAEWDEGWGQVLDRILPSGGTEDRTPTEPVDANWRARAACLGVDPSIFFPERGQSTDIAKSICSGCPVAGPCLNYALEHGETVGIWGQLSERQRREVRKARGISARPRKTAPCGTEAGAKAHYRRGETPCIGCREAANAAKNARTVS